ncbi:hypothetical protein NBRC116587_11930 [Pseudoteredinibacter isoporae]
MYFVGSGCGDPELLSLKAHRLLQSADVILFDALVDKTLHDYFPRRAETIYVGKRCSEHSMSQTDIGELMVSKARLGATVIRLKGGDPSIFARLAEETDLLSRHNIPFAVVPGVTAASGCSAYSGIPLTHRDCAQSVKFVTAYQQAGGADIDWKHLACESGTLVFYMGLSKITYIAHQLMAYGMDCDTAIAVVDKGSLSDQCVLISQLRSLETDLLTVELSGPAMIIVGEVVNRRASISLELLAEPCADMWALLSFG